MNINSPLNAEWQFYKKYSSTKVYPPMMCANAMFEIQKRKYLRLKSHVYITKNVSELDIIWNQNLFLIFILSEYLQFKVNIPTIFTKSSVLTMNKVVKSH